MKSQFQNELQEFGVTLQLIEKTLSCALSRGGNLAELFFEQTQSTRIFFEQDRVDKVMNGKDQGVGLRIIFDGKSVYGYSTDLSEEALLKLASDLTMAIPQSKKPHKIVSDWSIAKQPVSSIADYAVAKSPRSLPLDQKIEVLKKMDGAAKAILPTALQVSSIWLDSFRKILIANSEGVIAPDTKTYLQLVCQVVGEKQGRVESAYESDGGFVGLEFLEENPPVSIAQEAARRVQVLLDSEPAPSGTMPVVISAQAGGTMIHEAVGHGLEADLACHGLSVYQNKLGQQVASPLISVIDDGTMEKKRGSYRFDDEGTPSQKTTLIENGVLKNYMVDRLSGMKFDLMPTGNGRRESFRHKPIVRMTNTYIAPGQDDPEAILKDTQWGVFVKAMGGGQVNTVTGDFVFAVTEGYLIHEGKLTQPIRGATLVGNGPKVLMQVDRLGNDLGFSTGTCGKDGQGAPVTDAQPTLRVPELTVGGEVPVSRYWPKS